MNGNPDSADIVLQLVPFLIINIAFAIPNILLARRIGWSPVLIGILSLFFGWFMSIILIYKGLFVALDRTRGA